MASLIHLDTHVVVWLWTADRKRLRPLRTAIEQHDLVYSPMVELELEYLHEVGRLKPVATTILHSLADTIGLSRCAVDFGDTVSRARQLTWTRDPFDRLIVATALVADAELLTCDKTILSNFDRARAK